MAKENNGYTSKGGFLIDKAIEWARTYRLKYNSNVPQLERFSRDFKLNSEVDYPSKSDIIDHFIDDNIPPILHTYNVNVPTDHFTPANGYSDTTYNIFDVADGNYKTLQGTLEKNPYINQVRGYRVIKKIEEQVAPLATTNNILKTTTTLQSAYDYSRINIITTQNTEITVTDPSGNSAYINSSMPNTIPNSVSYTDPGTNLISNAPHIPDHHYITIFKPQSETYQITTEGSANLEIYSVNSDFEGGITNVNLAANSLYSLSYDLNTGTSTVEEIPTYTSYRDLIHLIRQLKQQGHFLKPKTAKVLIKMLQFAKIMDNKSNKVSQLTIRRLQRLISNLTPKHLDQAGSDQLQTAIEEFKQNHFE